MLVALGLLMELIDLGLRAAGLGEAEADLVSLVAVVLIASRFLREFPPDRPSLEWAARQPALAAAIVGAAIAVLLVGWFFLTEDDAGEAAGASALALLVAAFCAWSSRRGYARRAGG